MTARDAILDRARGEGHGTADLTADPIDVVLTLDGTTYRLSVLGIACHTANGCWPDHAPGAVARRVAAAWSGHPLPEVHAIWHAPTDTWHVRLKEHT